jgi:hypothetical protein
MRVSRWPWIVAILLATGPQLLAQTSNNPHVGYVYPGGGCRGTTFEVVVGGQYIKEVTGAYISGGGVKTSIVKWYRPMTQGEYVGLNMRISQKQEDLEKEIGKGAVTREMAIKELGITKEQLKEMEIYRKREADPKRQPNPQIAEELTVQVQLAPDAAFGDRELRLMDATAMSNPLLFYVGQYPEVSEEEPNDVVPNPSVQVKLPMVINGQIFPGDVDRFAFEAKKGTKLVASCAARGLIPYLADAVPGWFQAVLHLYDDQGTEVAFADSLGFLHDPVLQYEVPKDGNYVIEVHDSIYRGREDFTYRITIGEIPYVTGLFPLGGRAGEHCTVQVKGWNLPVSSIELEPAFQRGRSILPVVVEKNNIFSNRVGFVVDSLKEIAETEPNDTPEKAEEVTVPVVVNGRIDRPGDVDFYKFTGLGTVVAEVYARRLYSPLDSVVRLTDESGKVLAFNDDYEDKAWPLITHHADSRLLTTTKGAHYISISDAQGRGGPDYAYRLYIRPPRPDFDLRVTPASVTAQAGTNVPITVHAIRKDGFDADIALELYNAPKGFALSGAWVPGGQTKVRLTLTVPQEAGREPFLLMLDGYAAIQGKRLARPAVPSDEMTQAFAYQHVVPTKDWAVFVTGKPPGKLPCTYVDQGVRIPIGLGSGQARFKVDQGVDPRNMRFEMSEPPKGITLGEPVPVEPGGGLIVPVKVDDKVIKAGLKGNLLLILAQERSSLNKATGAVNKSRWVIGMLPAIPFEVVAGKR